MSKYSIIIPTYNPDLALFKQCIESITKQDYLDYELLIVLNGDTNEAQQYIKKTYSKKQNIMILDSPVKGISAARNYGLSKAKGNYILFVDDDDKYLDIHFLEIIDKNTNDIVFFYHSTNDNYMKKVINTLILDYKNIFDIFTLNNPFGIDNRSVWNKVFKKSIIEKHNIRFDENITNGGEDALFLLEYALKSRQGCLLDFAPYYHRVSKTSATYKYNINAIDEYTYFSNSYLNILRNNKAPVLAAYYNFCDYIINHIFIIHISHIENKHSFFIRARNIKKLYDKDIVKESIHYVKIKQMTTIAKKATLFLLKMRSRYLLLLLFDIKYRKHY